MKTLIEVSDLHKTFQQGLETIHALKGVNLSIQQGEFVAINGYSGSGKSTLLNIIGTLDKPTSGEVQLFNQSINFKNQLELQKFRAQKLGFIFQNFNLNPVLSALENVQMPLLLTNLSQKQRLEKSAQILEKVGLANRLHHKPKQLSGGQQQRVAVARALVSSPALLLADEPTANLDSHSALQLMLLLKEMNQASGLTVLFSSHDQRLLTHIDRTITLNDGVLQSSQGSNYEVA
ncbi:ABC transporter ATP-binding protein [Psychromonas sp. Urea-02u-13]|uniref:ABC transporter ATP-binding protein n=1 Tax=Psychromonas sp. Urea-02u-13 TaxID=2058326 RepID=UPI000C32376F|nr:ABC transporter ATP-binding protein [Psychromonas sp. Urea-02u-13]PKG40000.1 lipoprotein-releasing system ATP-binding protein LolD [Psychromonas sp. Urea-02u-13]